VGEGDNDKSDLSDLKSRLGLDRDDSDKETEDETDGSADAKQKQSAEESDQPDTGKDSPESETSKPSQAPEPPPSVRATQKISGDDEQEAELDNEELEAVGQTTFSTPVLILLAILFVVGCVVGVIGGNTMQTRDLYHAQQRHAQTIYSELEPKLKDFEIVAESVSQMSTTDVDFEITKAIADKNIVPDANLLAGKKLFFGREALGPLTSYLIEAGLLSRLIERHRRMTLEVDKKRLESLMKSDTAQLSRRIAVSFDYRHLAKQSRKDGYRPRPGQLVEIPASSLKEGGQDLKLDDKGRVEIKGLKSDATKTVYLRSLIPVQKDDLLDAAGPNALQRYKDRVRELKAQVKQIQKYSDSVLSTLEKIANRKSAPLIAF
jgi:hypothetical protein